MSDERTNGGARAPQIPAVHVAEMELPRELEGLYDLAYNLWWTWSDPTRQLFATIDPDIWALYRNPVQLLLSVRPERWRALASSETFLRTYQAARASLARYMSADTQTWFGRRFPAYDRGPIAYFSMEYGVHSSLAVYSGGLGVLSGDHCKTASDLGLPFVALGLLYRNGYFRQTVDADGRQQHTYPEYDFHRLPLRPVVTASGREVVVKVQLPPREAPLPTREVALKVWVAQVGRVPLLLLDSDVPQNDSSDRPITNILYTQGREMRLVQEILLGVGGVKALRALGIAPAVWHMNEGHSVFLQFERMRELVEGGATPAEARARVARDTAFTTHTPVPAGNEQFEPQLAKRYLAPYANALRVDADELLALGNADHGEPNQNFNLTAVALRTSSFANGVSRLNAEVTSRMWRHVFPGSGESPDPQSLPIIPITNGIHTETWLGPEMLDLVERRIGGSWRDLLLEPQAWRAAIDAIPAEEVWSAHMGQSERLGRFLRSRLRDQQARLGRAPDDLRAIDDLFRADALTIGFARRFATYKRASLIFGDLHRLRNLLADERRPVQILFAGKAHPADRPGQELIQHIFQLSQEERFRGKVFFIEDYDMRVGKMLVAGVDVWLNNPRRPMEASGTSGQKAAVNGALNWSVLDGWWPEGYDGENGWVIGSAREFADQAEQDREDTASLYHTLEEAIVPEYYTRDERGLPRRWIERMKHSIATLGPAFSAHRMVRDYAEKAYVPLATWGAR
jgi:starch phosphorylase